MAGEDEEAVDDEDTPQLDTIMVQHEGVINRLRVSGRSWYNMKGSSIGLG